jgi:hypothetical protein
MSVVFTVMPLMLAAWPGMIAAIEDASSGLGYRRSESEPPWLKEQPAGPAAAIRTDRGLVEIPLEDSAAVSDTLGRGESYAVTRDGITATFHRNGRGRCVVHMAGPGRRDEELEAAGRELIDRVRQQFAYARVKQELEARGFDVVQERVEADRSIRLRVRRWS